MKCKKCGVNVAKDAQNCENCGAYIPSRVNIFCVIALAVAVVSVLYNTYCIVSVVSIVFAIVGLKKIKGTREIGKGIVIASLIIAGLTMAWWIAVTILDYVL